MKKYTKNVSKIRPKIVLLVKGSTASSVTKRKEHRYAKIAYAKNEYVE